MNAKNWAILILGIWITISPWVLNFFEHSFALYSNVLVGVLIIVVEIWLIFGDKKDKKEDRA